MRSSELTLYYCPTKSKGWEDDDDNDEDDEDDAGLHYY